MTQLFSKYTPPPVAPVMPAPPPPTLSPSGAKPGKATQVPSLLGLAGAGAGGGTASGGVGSQGKGGGKSLLGQ